MGLIAGCAQPGAVRVTPNVVAGGILSQPVTATSQPATGAIGDTSGGRDTRIIQPVTTISGSGGILLAAIAVVGICAVALMYLRQRRFAENTGAAVSAIRDMGPGAQRDKLLERIDQRLVDQGQWDRFVRSRNSRVKRQGH